MPLLALLGLYITLTPDWVLFLFCIVVFFYVFVMLVLLLVLLLVLMLVLFVLFRESVGLAAEFVVFFTVYVLLFTIMVVLMLIFVVLLLLDVFYHGNRLFLWLILITIGEAIPLLSISQTTILYNPGSPSSTKTLKIPSLFKFLYKSMILKLVIEYVYVMINSNKNLIELIIMMSPSSAPSSVSILNLVWFIC